VIHRLRGRESNNLSDRWLRQRAIGLCRIRYAGFGPTLAAEKLSEDDGIALSVETLRGWMLAEGLWERKRQREKHRARRARRECFGEMVQADASTHDWLEGRGPMLALVGLIDDATDRVALRFHESENDVCIPGCAGPVDKKVWWSGELVQRSSRHFPGGGIGGGL